MANSQSTTQLSKRELQVLELVVTGASNQEIASRLVISINTVKVHIRNIFAKLEVQSRTEATLVAIQEGLVNVAEPEAEAAEESEAGPAMTYLLGSTRPARLPPWRLVYLLLAILLAMLILFVPTFQQQSQTTTAPLLPVIYVQSEPQEVVVDQPVDSSNRWITSHSRMPSHRAGLALVSSEREIYAIGGVKANNIATRQVEIFDIDANSWVEGGSKPTATVDIDGVLLDDKIYVPGGCTGDGVALDALEIYTPDQDSWTKGASLPEARCGYGLTVYDEQLYLFGGWNGKVFEDSIFVYTPQTDTWETLPQTLPRPMGYMGIARLDQEIYLVGGYDGEAEFDTTYAFDPKTGAWQPKAPLNEKRGGLGLISDNQSLYAIGGGWIHSPDSSERYDPALDQWIPFEAAPTSKWRNMGLTRIDTTIYAVGGWNGTDKEFMDGVASYQFLFHLFLPVTFSR